MNGIEKRSGVAPGKTPEPGKGFARVRMRVMGVFLAILFAVVCGKALHLHLVVGDSLREKAARQVDRTITLRGKRGRILDRAGKEIARSADALSVGAYPGQIKETEPIAKSLASTLKMNPVQLQMDLIAPRPFVWVKRQVTPREASAVRDLKLTGVDFVSETCRYYPKGVCAAQLIGLTGIDGRGLEGLEYQYDQYLTGGEKQLMVRQDALGNRFEVSQEEDPAGFSGNDLVLTIDLTIQFIVEDALAEAVRRVGATSGMAVVMQPNTGAVLAMANVPLFNPNAYTRFDRKLWRNRVITDAFEPGSTMKIFSASAAVESGGCTPDTIFFCENGKYRIGGNVIHDTKAHGWLPLKDIVKYSSNIGAIKLSEMLGPDPLYRTLANFGFGTKSGIECPGETNGTLISGKKWSKIDAAVISYGYGVSVSAIQLVSAMSAIANGGVLMRPYVVQAVMGHDGREVERFGPQEIRQAISPATARVVRDMMRGVVEKGGTGERAALQGYTVAGKTGTAHKVISTGGYAADRYVASFLGFVPAEDPKLSILVVIDDPRTEYYGGLVAAPVFQSIARQSLTYLNIPPQHMESSPRLTASAGSADSRTPRVQ